MSIRRTEPRGISRLSTAVMALFLVLALGFALNYPRFAIYGQTYTLPAPPPQTSIFRPTVVVPTDVTSNLNQITEGGVVPRLSGDYWALYGVQQATNFPSAGSPDVPLSRATQAETVVRTAHGTLVQRVSPSEFDLKSGSMLVSAYGRSAPTIIRTSIASVAIFPDGSIIVTSIEDPVVRVLNLDASGQKVLVRLDKGPFAKQPQTVAIAPGYELVASDHEITRADMRPHDGLARRHWKVLANKYMAIGEFSVESAMHTNSLVVNLEENVSGVKERRIVSDMSRMAAILNYMHGTAGFTAEKK